MFDFDYDDEFGPTEASVPHRYGRVPARRPATADERRYSRRESADITADYDEVDFLVEEALVALTGD